MRKKSGFTLIELLITLALLSIIVVMVARIGPSVTAQSRFRGLVNNFQADYASAKLLASTENRYVAITFSADGHSYIIQKQTDITNYTTWTQVKKVTPLSDLAFFDSGEVADFVVNSTGEVRPFPVPNPLGSPTNITLKFYIKSQGKKVYQRNIQIFPYGGLKVEK
jgi:prepilin-type N-terminal cleavage/methylation domain-containing protein